MLFSTTEVTAYLYLFVFPYNGKALPLKAPLKITLNTFLELSVSRSEHVTPVGVRKHVSKLYKVRTSKVRHVFDIILQFYCKCDQVMVVDAES